jgi:hypothetical protein
MLNEKVQTSSEELSQLAHFLNDPTVMLNWYTPSDAAKVFGCHPHSVRSWIEKGWIKSNDHMPMTHVGKVRHNRFSVRYIHVSEIERILGAERRLIQYTKRTWPRLLWKLEHGEKVR